MDDPYRRRRGELQSLGEILHAALKVADQNCYRPERPFQHARKTAKKRKKDDGKLQGVQLEFKFPEPVRDSERPLIDLIPEAYQ
jgi:hypothetical protein